MKRIFLIPSTGLLLLASGLLPAAASAQHDGHHHHHHRGAHRRLERFEAHNPAAASGHAGTVTSFVGGTLTITLNDGTSVAGKVTSATELECEAAQPPTTATASDHGGGGPSGSDGRDGPGRSDGRGPGDGTTPGATSNPAPESGSGDDNGRDGEDVDGPPAPIVERPAGNDRDHTEGQVCMTALIAGAVVHRAELRISSTGATFLEVDILT